MTGEQIQIPAKRVVKFRVAKAAKEAIGGKSKTSKISYLKREKRAEKPAFLFPGSFQST